MSSTVLRPGLFPFPPSPNHSGYPQRGPSPPTLHFQKIRIHDTPLAHGATVHAAGLRTPPAEDSMMSTAYSNPVLSNSYDNHVALARQPSSALMHSGRAGGGYGEGALNPFARVPTQQHQTQYQSQYHPVPQPQPQQHHQPRVMQQNHLPSAADLAPQSLNYSSSSRSANRHTTPSPASTMSSHDEGTVSRRDSAMVGHSLHLPECISPNGGSLDDFAASMTCFFWFESMDTVYAAEHIKNRRPSELVPQLSRHTEPCAAYKKWVHSILSTTQVTQNVILLALLFIYRLKKSNPKVNGNPGSEYRLLTVALMLGNKFLDDNTYTNKTWAEVSGISVKEIHIMEVEFLSNMRYGLLTSKEQWQEWLKKLACYHEYCERARTDHRHRQAAPLPLNVPSPTHGRFSSPLPSPTSILPSSMQGTPMPLAAYSPNTAVPVANPNWHPSYHPVPSVSAHAARPSQGVARKRSLDNPDIVEPAPKRAHPQPQVSMLPSSRPKLHNESVRLPIPHLTLDTTQATAPSAAPPVISNLPPQSVVSLPPLGPGVRAMSTVFPTTTTWAPQGPIMATCGPQTPSYTAPSNFGTPTKRHSPGSLNTFGSSPLMEPYPTHTPISNSPSVYLQQRASPYKPIRHVKTLLYPPPSMPLSEYHLGSNQMHYQPLGRRNDLRSGIVPDFLPTYGNARQAH